MLAYVQKTDGREDLYVSRLAGGEHVRLTNDDSRKDSPEFSPDGEKIVFVRQLANASQSELCLIPALGGSVVPIASGAQDPTWSHDGSRLAFILRKQPEPEALVTSAVDGSDIRVVLKGDDLYPFLAGPSWSPDGRLLTVQRSRGGINRDIWRSEEHTSELQSHLNLVCRLLLEKKKKHKNSCRMCKLDLTLQG